MRMVVLSDNISKSDLNSEWGLSCFLEFDQHKILLDTGASDLFIENASKLGVDLNEIEYAFLSHAHFDHGNGMEAFFRVNDHAKFYLQKSCACNCYIKKQIFTYYCGLPSKVLSKYKDRIVRCDIEEKITDGIYVVGHKTQGLYKIGKDHDMYKRVKRKWVYDDFDHEQSLIFDTDDGLIIFNSCCHGKVVNIIKEVSDTFKDKKIYSIVGGFHLYDRSEDEIRALAKYLKDKDIKIYTGHCTGDRAMAIFNELLNVNELYVGMDVEI